MESFLTSFGIEWKALLAQAINFGILVFVLAKFAYKPIINAIEKREEAIKKLTEDSSSAEKLLSLAVEKQEIILKEARTTSEKMLKETEKSVLVLRNNLLDEAKKDSQKLIADGERKLLEEKEKFYSGLRKELIGLVSEGIEKTVGKYLTKDAVEKLKDEALEVALRAKK